MTNRLLKLLGDNQLETLTVRDLLRQYGAQRRGRWVVARIRADLDNANLFTAPDFESAYIDDYISILRDPFKGKSPPQDLRAEILVDEPEANQGVIDKVSALDEVTNLVRRDPTYRISKLASASQGVVHVKPDTKLAEIITIMMARDFSQLPVMQSEREVKGVVSWRSIGTRLSLQTATRDIDALRAFDLMDAHHEIRSSFSLFDAIPLVLANDYVLVRGQDQRITGLITANDLSVQFRTISEPFLLLSEIENQLRELLKSKFSVQEMSSARDPSDHDRLVESVDDLTFGEYIRLIEEPGRWQRLNLSIDRSTFCKYLDDARRIRNDVMHFDPDGVPDEDLASLRRLTRFLKELDALGAHSRGTS